MSARSAASRALRLAAAALALGACAASERPPNILLIYVDDQAPDALGFEGNPVLESPNLDRLAREGTFFSRSYVPLPQCAPSRAALLTGRYPHAVEVMTNIEKGLDPALPTLAKALGEVGYRRGFIGKWHLGNPDRPQAGFDDTWIALDLDVTGHRRYFDPSLWIDGVRERQQGYLPRILTDRAIEFIERPDERPFFLWLAYKTPHYPYVRPRRGPPRYPPSEVPLPASVGDDLSAKPGPQRNSYAHEWFLEYAGYGVRSDTARYYAMLAELDEQIGRLMQRLAERGLRENTLVIFTSDNGVLLGEHQMVGKGPALYEELVRVPLIFHWPGVVPAGEQRDDLVTALDLFPTLAAIAGAKAPESLDGEDIWQRVLGRGEPVRDAVFFEYRAKGMTGELQPMLGVATAGHKYVRYLASGEEEFYDLVRDPHEMNNLVGTGVQPEELERLRARVDRFHETIDFRFWEL